MRALQNAALLLGSLSSSCAALHAAWDGLPDPPESCDGGLDVVIEALRPVRVLRSWHGAQYDGLGAGVEALGDVDGDGVPDLLIGSTTGHNFAMYGTGAVAAYSGASGRRLWMRRSSKPRRADDWGDALGRSLRRVGDVDGDGCADVAVPSWWSEVVVRVLSGRDGHVLSQFVPDGPGETLAPGDQPDLRDYLFRSGDLDGDGADDYLVHAIVGELERDRTIAVSSRTGARLFDAPGRPVSATNDVDGDGARDLFVAPDGRERFHHPSLPFVELRSGRTRELLSMSPIPVHVEAEFAGSAGDLDRDGFEDRLSLLPADGTAYESGVPLRCVAFVHSGRDARELLAFPLDAVFDGRVGVAENVGDVDGDGTDDFWFTCRHGNRSEPTRVTIRSGGDGRELVRLESDAWIGQHACGLGDLDGDGRGDVLVGDACATSHGVYESGRAYVLAFPEH